MEFEVLIVALLAFNQAFVESSKTLFKNSDDFPNDSVASASNKKPEKRGLYAFGYGSTTSNGFNNFQPGNQRMAVKEEVENYNENAFFSPTSDQSNTGQFGTNLGTLFNNHGGHFMFNPAHTSVGSGKESHFFGNSVVYGNGEASYSGGYEHPPVKMVYITKEIPVPFPVHVERKIPFLVKIPVDKPVPITISRPYPVHIEKPVPFPVKVHVPKPYPITIEKHFPYPVRVPVDKPFPVHVPRPYPVFVEKKVPIAIEKPVPYPVKVPVDRPYAVHIPVEKPVPVHIEKKIPYPVKIPVDKPIPVQVSKPFPVTVEKPVPYIVEKPVPYAVKVPDRTSMQNLQHQTSGFGSNPQENSNNHGMSFSDFNTAFENVHQNSAYGSSSGSGIDFVSQDHEFNNAGFDMSSDFEEGNTLGGSSTNYEQAGFGAGE